MRTTAVVSILAGVASVQAAGRAGSFARFNEQLTDSYDDLGETSNGIPGQMSPILVTDGGISYTNWKYSSVGMLGGMLGNAPGVQPNTGRNVAITLNPPSGSIATTGRCVVLSDFYYGCNLLNTANFANIPIACTVTATAYGEDNTVLGTQELEFMPDNMMFSDLSLGISRLPPAKLIRFDATTTVPIVGMEVPALIFDDVTYTQYDSSAAGVVACGGDFEEPPPATNGTFPRS